MPFRILSLDGGGSWALIQARILKDIYGNIRGHELLRKFDMAIANSGGSLVLACLCNNMTLDQAIEVFENESNRKKAFSELTFGEKLTKRNFLSFFRNKLGIGPKYKTTRKLEGLREVLTEYDERHQNDKTLTPIVDMHMNELPGLIGKQELELMIVGFDYFKERVSFFRSNLNSNTDRFSKGKFKTTLGYAIHSSSNAPVNYFDEPAAIKIKHTEKDEIRTSWFWDGAVAGFNNPVMAALVEAVTNARMSSMSEYRILSIGTGVVQRPVITDYSTSTDPAIQKIYKDNKNNPYVISDTRFRFFDDVTKIAQSILSDPPDSATFIAYSFLDPSLENKESNIVRINPCIAPVFDGKYYIEPEVYKNNPEDFKALIDLDMDAVEDEEIKQIKLLCKNFITTTDPCVPNQFIRGDEKGDRLGYGKYWEAKQRWIELM